jgi:hypothetical protein
VSESLVRKVVNDTDNNLAEIVRDFQSSNERVWYIDRHVLDVAEAEQLHSEVLIAACEAAVALARSWFATRRNLAQCGVLISKPYVIIDDEWLRGERHTAPPHVLICLARDRASFAPVDYRGATTVAAPNDAIGGLIAGRERILRRVSQSRILEEAGEWIIDLDDEAEM